MATQVPPSLVRASLFALGATSIAFQIILLREFLSVFSGNELIIGMVLANWMIITGLGSFLGKLSDRRPGCDSSLGLALMAIALLPPVTVALLRVLRNLVFTTGSMIGIEQAFVFSLALLLPYCLVSGFLFSFFCAMLSSRQGTNAVALSYSWESWGSAAGGALFSLVVLPLLDTFQAFFVLLAGDLCLSCLVAYTCHNRKKLAFTLALICTTALFLVLGHPDAMTRKFLFPSQELLYFRDTPYGNLTITRQGEQMNFFENNVLMFSSGEIVGSEENVHYAMVQRLNPRRVLLIGGGPFGTIQEILKYPEVRVDYAEANPWLIDVGKSYTPDVRDPRINVINDDPRRLVRHQSPGSYDVALLALPDPESAFLNRYYTLDFFSELKRVLATNAVISLSLLSGTEYLGPESLALASSLYATLKAIFAHVLIIPGNRNFFLASDQPLDLHIGRLIEQRGIATSYVNKFYLDDDLLGQRSRELTDRLLPSAPINTDFAPVGYFQHVAYWLSSLGATPRLWIFLLVLAAVMVAWQGHAVGMAIFASGFSGAGLEMVLLLSFQALYGSLYQMTGIVITAFMAGLAVGSWFIPRILPQAKMNAFILLQLLVTGFGLLLPLVLSRLQTGMMGPLFLHFAFTAMAFSLAVLVGMEFAVAARLRPGTAAAIAGELYGLDLAGSALGALVITVYAIPLLGIQAVSQLIGFVSATGAVVCYLRRNTYRVAAS